MGQRAASLGLFGHIAAGFCGDLLFALAVLWTLTERGASRLALGLALGLAALVPSLLERFAPTLESALARRPLLATAIARGGAGLLTALLGAVPKSAPNAALFGLAGLHALFTAVAAQASETAVANEVLSGRMTSAFASRWLQIATQLGCLVGGLAVGTLLERGGLAAVSVAGAALYACLVVAAVGLDRVRAPSSEGALESFGASEDPGTAPRSEASERRARAVLVAAFIAIVVLTVQMSGESLLLVSLVQLERRWSASAFGLLDAMFCAGAVAGAVVGTTPLPVLRRAASVGALGIAAFCWAQGLLPSLALVAPSAFGYGFFFNALRAAQRQHFFASATGALDAARWTGRLTSARMAAEAATPVLLGALLSSLRPSLAYVLFGTMSGLVLGAVQLVQWRQGRA